MALGSFVLLAGCSTSTAPSVPTGALPSQSPVTAAPTTTPPSGPRPTPTDTSPVIRADAQAFCELVDPVLVETILGAPILELRTELSPSGGALCSYSTRPTDSGEGSFLIVSFDRDANLARWRPSDALTAAGYYARRRTELAAGDPGQDVAGIGLRAWESSLGLAIALFEPDILVELSFDPRTAPTGVATFSLRSIGTEIAAVAPPNLAPLDACVLLEHETVQSELGGFVDEVDSHDPFDPLMAAHAFDLPPGGATACSYVGPDTADPLGVLVWLDVVRYRTDRVREWLRSDASIGRATDEQRAAAGEIDALSWVASYIVGDPLEITGACQASWDGRALFILLEADDVVALQLPLNAGQAAAARLGEEIVAAAQAERGAPASCSPLG